MNKLDDVVLSETSRGRQLQHGVSLSAESKTAERNFLQKKKNGGHHRLGVGGIGRCLMSVKGYKVSVIK